MGAVEAQKDRWGLFADAIYMDVGDELVASTTLAKGSVPLPPGATADAELGIEATVFSVAANRRVLEHERSMLDVFAGARWLDAQVALDASLASPLGPIAAVSSERDQSYTDGVVGVKGKITVGEGGKWFVPFYFDVGAGDSDRTSQAASGIGLSTRWGEVFGTVRFLDYDFKSDSAIADLDFTGPAIGVLYRF
jgi:hypothetical protein